MIERYFLKEMKDIWGEENYYRKWQEVEAAVLKARGNDELADELMKVKIDPAEVRRREEESGHELNSFLAVFEDELGSKAGIIHAGLTSSDIMDTARILQLRESYKIIKEKLSENIEILKKLSNKYKNLLTNGRTHGQIAEPTTLGLKFARFLTSAERTLERMNEARKRIMVGQISGAVGTYSLISPEEEEKILGILDLKPVTVSSQIIPRDIFAEYLYIMAMISSFAEEVALEIRLMSQDGIKEVTEPFTSKQAGSSAMPHKQNPVICERICGLARLVKNYAGVGLSNIALWNERDISHSSNERIVLEESSSLTYYILVKNAYVLENINVHEENIEKNFKAAGVRLFSSGVLKLLLDRNAARGEAYSLVKELFKKDVTIQQLKEILKDKYGIDGKSVESVADTKPVLENAEKIFSRLEKE